MGRHVLLLTAVLFTLACAESDFEEDVAGIARLSVLQVALLANEIAEDQRCGFQSAGVKTAVVVEGLYAERGTATYRVDDCAIGFDAVEKILDNCGRDSVRLSGRARVTGTLVVEGIVSGRDDDPIIPGGPDAVRIHLQRVVLDGFRAHFDSTDAELVMREGSLSAEVRPRLARADDTGFCAIPTGDAEVRHLAYDDASLLAKDGSEALVFVPTSDLRGQIGRGARSENTFAGELTIGGQRVEVPREGDAGLLDEDYDRADFESQFMCDEDLRLPLDYACACEDNSCHPDAPVADGVARLLPQVFGNVVALIEDQCDFSAPTYDAEVGAQGTATYAVADQCHLRFAMPHHRDTDCDGIATFISGEARVTGEKIVRGYLTGDIGGDATVPTTMDGVTYDLAIELQDFLVRTSSDTPSIEVKTGVLRGTMAPLFALDAAEGACVKATAFARFDGLELVDGTVVIVDPNDGDPKRHELALERSAVSAVVGRVGASVNQLQGTVTAGGELFRVPSDGGGLQPHFDLNAATRTFACEDDLIWPTAPADCSFKQELGPDVARAAMALLATAVARVSVDDACGLDSATAQVTTNAQVGAEGTVTTAITQCVVTETNTDAVGDDCHRKRTYAEGTVELTGTREATGRVVRDVGRTTVDPLRRDPYRDHFDLVFRDYRTWTVERDTTTPIVDTWFTSGTAMVDVIPILGENEETPGVFDIPTPIARVPMAVLQNVDAIVASYGRHFRVKIDEAQLEVLSGVYEGRGNTIVGFVVVDGERVELPEGTMLDTAYDQAEFDFSYACTPDLLEPVPAR